MDSRSTSRLRLSVVGCGLFAALLWAPGLRAEDPGIHPSGPALWVTADPRGAATPSVAADRAGNFVAAWLGHATDSSLALVVRKFDAGGNPLGPEIEVFRDQYFYGRPRIAASPDGRMVVVWSRGDDVIRARFLAADGQPAGPAFPLSEPFDCCQILPDIAFLTSGDFVVIWHVQGYYNFEPTALYEPIQGRIFDPTGAPRGDAFAVTPQVGAREQSRVVADPQGGFAVAWVESFVAASPLRVRRFANDGTPRGPEAAVTNDVGFGPVPVFTPEGELTVAWIRPVGTSWYGDAAIYAQRLAQDGSPSGAKILLAPGVTLSAPLDAVDDRAGHRLLVWGAPNPGGQDQIVARLFDTAWQPAGPVIPVAQFTQRRLSATHSVPPWPAVAAGPSGFLAVWDGVQSPVGLYPQIAAQSFAGNCLASADKLCLASAARFRIEVAWRDPRSGSSGAGKALPLTGDTGAFWFFSAGNAELLVKVLDGRPVNGHWWVFFGALTDLEYDLTVTDTWTGARQIYHNPPYTLASRADVLAFAETPPAAASLAPPAVIAAPRPAQGTCGGQTCIGQFGISVEFTDPRTGQTHAATGTPLGSDSGIFWFFDRDNLELIVKVLDGRAVNGHWWVFYGALSDVEYTIQVTSDDGHTRTYHNPHGQMASRADTQAF